MSTTFVCSDTHFSHRGIVKFLREDNVTKERPWDNIEEMDEALVKNWNSVVRPTDTVYHLGDVVINRSALPILGRLNGTKILVKGNHDCLDALTECLTKRGWLSYDNLTDHDQVFSLNPVTNLGEWKPIDARIIKDHNGPVWELASERMSMVVTENHRVMFRNTEAGNIKYSSPGDIRGLMYIPTATEDGCIDYDIPDVHLKAMAWYYTDGCLNKHKDENRAICFYQSKASGMEQLECVLDGAGFAYTKSSEGVTSAGTLVAGKPLVKDSLEAFVYRMSVKESSTLLRLVHKDRYVLPDWIYNISSRQARVFIRELINGDGSYGTWQNSNAAVLYGKLAFLEQVQRLCVTKGINANLSVFRETDHRLNINFGSMSKVYSISHLSKKGKWGVRHYDGKVWCISTEYTNFMVRRKGQSFFTGNCFRAEEYLEYFKDIRGSAVLNNLVMTHIPLHPASIERWDGNVHGHLHSKRVRTVDYRGGDMFDVIDPRYLCVSMEHINYTPISLEEVMKRFKEQQ